MSTSLKRIPIKYIRDRAKSKYKKDSACFVCATTNELDLHHLFTVDLLFTNWCRKNNITISSVEDIIDCRDDFISSHHYELYEYVRTLCKSCHKRLHTVYSQKPPLSTAPKQENWLNKQREKHLNKGD